MNVKISSYIFVFLLFFSCFSQFSMATYPGEIQSGSVSIEYHNVSVYAPAVAQTENGYEGVISTITVTIQNSGSGRVFVDTLPLTQVDMQGSARLAVKVAGAFVKNDKSLDVNPDEFDYFFVIRTSAPVIGGPSAGAVMTLATIALLENWTIDKNLVMTGMINPDGSIGPIGGIPYKVDAANSVGATRFLIPKGQMTYTETVTETTTINGWTQIITKPVTRNVSEYAMDNYGMEVFEVEDINEVLLYATGHTFVVPESEHQITTQDYINAMRPLAESLLSNAEDLFNNATEVFDNSDIPNRWPYYYKNQVTDYLNYAESYLSDAEELYQTDLFYSSASKSFQSLISSHFVSYACDYFSSDDEDGYISNLINETHLIYESKNKLVKNEDIKDMISLQCVGIAQKKAVEASSYLNDAINSFNNSNYLNCLYQLAYSYERSNSVEWWINLSSQFNDTNSIDQTTITALAEEYIDNAQQSIAYATVLLQEIGQSSNFLTSAEELLVTARNDEDQGYPAAALFDSLEALVKGNLALELVDGVTKDKLDRARESASISISESRMQGIEPILSVSYYELAESLENESSYDNAIFQYKYSDLIAGMVRLTSSSGSYSSRYIGIPESNLNSSEKDLIIDINEFSILQILIGCFIGLFIGIIICSIVWIYKHNKDVRSV
jgi:uncharacterized protein